MTFTIQVGGWVRAVVVDASYFGGEVSPEVAVDYVKANAADFFALVREVAARQPIGAILLEAPPKHEAD